MSIYRPQEQASRCEEMAAYCNLPHPWWQERRREFIKRRDTIVRKFEIECCVLKTALREVEK